MTQLPAPSVSSAPVAPFAGFAPRTPLANPLRAAITAAYRRPEPEALAPLLAQARLPQWQPSWQRPALVNQHGQALTVRSLRCGHLNRQGFATVELELDPVDLRLTVTLVPPD